MAGTDDDISEYHGHHAGNGTIDDDRGDDNADDDRGDDNDVDDLTLLFFVVVVDVVVVFCLFCLCFFYC